MASVAMKLASRSVLTELTQTNLARLESRVTKQHPKRLFELLETDDMWHTMQYVGKTKAGTRVS